MERPAWLLTVKLHSCSNLLSFVHTDCIILCSGMSSLVHKLVHLKHGRLSTQADLLVPHSRTVIRQCRAFSVAGPTAWNGLPVALHLTPVAHSALFPSGLKTTLFDRGWAGSAPE